MSTVQETKFRTIWEQIQNGDEAEQRAPWAGTWQGTQPVANCLLSEEVTESEGYYFYRVALL